MKIPDEKKGLVIFIVLALLVIIISLAAYHSTGEMGIEERFTHAVGLESGSVEGDRNGWFGFSLEGSSLLYTLVLGILVVTCYVVYRNFRM